MAKSVEPPRHVAFFSALSYLGVAMQWAWIAILLAPVMMRSGFFQWLSNYTSARPRSSLGFKIDMPDALSLLIIVAVFIFVIAIAIYAAVKMPVAIIHTSEQTVATSSKLLLPVITHKHKISSKRKLSLSRRIVTSLRIAGVVIPLLIGLALKDILPELDPFVIVVITLFLGGVSVSLMTIYFILQRVATPRRTHTFRKR